MIDNKKRSNANILPLSRRRPSCCSNLSIRAKFSVSLALALVPKENITLQMQSKNFNTFQTTLYRNLWRYATVCRASLPGCFPQVQTALVQVPFMNLVQCCGSGFNEQDPAFQVNPDPNTDPDPIWIQGFDDQKVTKKKQLKFVFLFQIKITLYLALGLHKGRPSYRRSLPPSKEYIQYLKFINLFFYFCGSFLPPWIRIRRGERGSACTPYSVER